jgi:hypothetical protein
MVGRASRSIEVRKRSLYFESPEKAIEAWNRRAGDGNG